MNLTVEERFPSFNKPGTEIEQQNFYIQKSHAMMVVIILCKIQQPLCREKLQKNKQKKKKIKHKTHQKNYKQVSVHPRYLVEMP